MSLLLKAKDQTEVRGRVVLFTKTTLVLLAVLAIAAIEVSHLVFLTAYPPVFIDEAWNANAVWTWLKTGVNFDSMHAGTMDQYGYEWVRWPVIGNAPYLASLALLGIGLFQMRLVSWVFGLILLVAVVLVGRRSYSLATGVLAALILSLSSTFLQASHYARWDVMLAAVGMVSYGLALMALQKNKWWAHILTGLLIGLSLDVHQNGVLYALGLAAMYLAFYKTRILRQPGTWLVAAGGLLGIAFYVVVHILPSPNAYFSLFSLSFAGPHKVPVQSLNPLDLLASLRAEFGRYHFFENTLDFVVIGASIALLIVRRLQADRLLLAFAAATFAGFVLFIGNKHDIYAILLYPFLMLMVAEALVSLIREGQGFTRQRVFASVFLALLLFSSAVRYARPVYTNRAYDYHQITAKIASVIPAGARVMGYPKWWIGLADYDFRSSLNLTFYHYQNGYSLTQGLEAIRPDIIILDEENLQYWLVDEGYFPPGPGFEIYRLPRQEFEDFLARRGELLLEFSDAWHGGFEVYAIHWD
ncbi:MAG: hypothetical protein Kow0063_38290 [Anaerolineae bacterium]